MSGPLFIAKDSSLLSRQLDLGSRPLASAVSGLDCDAFSGHSFKIIACSCHEPASASKGIGDSAIRTLGRWRSDAYHAQVD